MKNEIVGKAFIKTLPVLVGYLFLGFGFGVLLVQGGYSMWYTLLMSTVMYGGAMQYAMVGMFVGNVSFLTVAFTTFSINARHLFYGISMLDKYNGTGAYKPYLIHAMTDETYTLLSGREEVVPSDRPKYYFFVSLFDHSYWILGGFLGGLFASLVEIPFQGLDFTLTALFVVSMTDHLLTAKNKLPTLIGFATTLLFLCVVGKEYFLLCSLLAIFLLLTVFQKGLGGEEK